MKKMISAATRHLGYKELWPLQRGDSGAVPSRERRICFPFQRVLGSLCVTAYSQKSIAIIVVSVPNKRLRSLHEREMSLQWTWGIVV